MMRYDKNIVFAFLLTSVYTVLSILYFSLFDSRFCVRNFLIEGINIAMPLPYITLTVFFMCCYAFLIRRKIRSIALPVAAMAMILPLFYLLTDLAIGIRSANPFSGTRTIYGLYTEAYFFAAMALFSVFCGLIFRKLLKDEGPHFLKLPDLHAQNLIFHLPIFVYFLFIMSLLFQNAFFTHPLLFLIFFIAAMSSDFSESLIKKGAAFVAKAAKKEALFLVAVFVLAAVIRYLWGLRILSITGANFVRASDDGLAYDAIAALLAAGEAVPSQTAFGLNGFAYWHFLAFIYRVFGIQNFKVLIAIQSLAGATVPVFTYLIGKRIFLNKAPAALSSLLVTFNMTLIFVSIVIGMEALYVPLFLLALCVAVYYLTGESFDIRKAFIIGSLFGFANNARGELIFAPVILASSVYFFMRRKAAASRIMLAMIFVFIGFALFASIQHIANYRVYSEFRLTQTSLGSLFTDKRFTDENAVLDGMGFNPFKSLKGSAVSFIRDPVTVSGILLKGYCKRLVIYFLQPNFGVFDPVYLVNPASGYFFRYPVYLQACGYILVLSGAFFLFRVRKNIIAKTMLVSFVFYISSIYSLLLLQNARNRGALIPMSALFSAYACNVFYRRLKDAYAAGEK